MELAIFKQDRIFIGKLDNDETQDAVVTYGYQKTGSMAYDRHLILLNTDSLPDCKRFSGCNGDTGNSFQKSDRPGRYNPKTIRRQSLPFVSVPDAT